MKHLILMLLFAATSGLFAQLPPGVDPNVDATGVLGQLADLEAANISERQKVIDAIQLDYHPVYGNVTSEMHPVSDSGFQLCQLEDLVPAGTKDVTVESVDFTGIGLVQHRIGDEDFYVWHRMENAELARISYPAKDPGTGSVYTKIIIINSHCGNWVAITLCDELDPYCNWLYNRFE